MNGVWAAWTAVVGIVGRKNGRGHAAAGRNDPARHVQWWRDATSGTGRREAAGVCYAVGMSPVPDELRRLGGRRDDEALRPERALATVALICLFGGVWLVAAPFAVLVAAAVGPPASLTDFDRLLKLAAGGLPAVAAAAAAGLLAIVRRRMLPLVLVACVPWLVSSAGAVIVLLEAFE